MNGPDEHADTVTDSRGFQQLSLSHEPTLPKILKCVLNITESEAQTYLGLLRHQNADVRTLADECGHSMNSVREHLSMLMENGLATRDTRVLEEGRHYTYQPAPADVKPLFHKQIKDWVKYVRSRISALPEDLTAEPIEFRSASAASSTENTSRPILHGKSVPLRNITACVFGLRAPLLELYLVLHHHPQSTAQELAKIQGFARSTVAGRLNDLQGQGLAHPVEREIGSTVAYEYVPRPLDEVKTAMESQLKMWSEYAHWTVDEYDYTDGDNSS